MDIDDLLGKKIDNLLPSATAQQPLSILAALPLDGTPSQKNNAHQKQPQTPYDLSTSVAANPMIGGADATTGAAAIARAAAADVQPSLPPHPIANNNIPQDDFLGDTFGDKWYVRW